MRSILLTALLACGPAPQESSELDALRGGRSRFWLADGEVVTGYLAVVYDHSRWIWRPSDEVTYAILVGDRFRFLSSLDIVDSRGVGGWPRPEVYDFMRSRGIWIEQSPLDGVAHVWTGNAGIHRDESGFGDFAWDLRITDDDGYAYSGSGNRNADYYVWNEPVYLPTSGVVTEVVRRKPDNPAGVLGQPSGNYLDVQIDGDFKLCLIHLKQDSIPEWIQPGVYVEAGTYVGRVGNSGYSALPHLHFTIYQYDDETQRLWSVPTEMTDVFLAHGLYGRSRFRAYAVPQAGDYLSLDRF